MIGFKNSEEKVLFAERVWFALRYIFPKLTPSEWTALSWIFERTISFKKLGEVIQKRHFKEGVSWDGGEILPITLSERTLDAALAGLQKHGIITKRSRVGSNQTWYSLRLISLTSANSAEKVRNICGPQYNYKDNITGCAGTHARTPTQELETGDTSMPAIPAKEALQSLLHNVTESTRRNRKERAKKMTATGYMAAWQDSFMAHYPEEKWFPWRTYEMSAFKKAISKIDEDQRELFVDFVIRDFEPTIMEQFSWMKAKPVVPHVGFVTKHIEIFYRAYRDYLDPNRTVKAKIKSSKPRIKPAPVANKKQDEEVARLKEENAKLRSENQKHRVRKVIVKRQRAQSIIRTRSVNPEFGKWSD